jgi:CheY-like chemotaxis protein
LHTPGVFQEGIKSVPALSSNPIHEPGLTATERILVIEDDRVVQKALKRLFEGEGYSVDVATDGSAGLEIFRKVPPSALVLDLRLPGMSGQEVCREITQIAPDLPIVILCARSDVADKVLLLEIGAHDYVTKPFSPRELLARVRDRGWPRVVHAPGACPECYFILGTPSRTRHAPNNVARVSSQTAPLPR